MSEAAKKKSDFGDWLVSHPRQGVQLIVWLWCCIWLLPAALLGLLVFILSVRLLRIDWKWVLGTGILLAGFTFLMEEVVWHFSVSLIDFVKYVGRLNGEFLRTLFFEGFSAALHLVSGGELLAYVLGLSVLMAGVLAALEMIPNSSHEKELRALGWGQRNDLSGGSGWKGRHGKSSLSVNSRDSRRCRNR